jgi:hypothetical protein
MKLDVYFISKAHAKNWPKDIQLTINQERSLKIFKSPSPIVFNILLRARERFVQDVPLDIDYQKASALMNHHLNYNAESNVPKDLL